MHQSSGFLNRVRSGVLLPAAARALDARHQVWLAAWVPDPDASFSEEVAQHAESAFNPEWIGKDPTADDTVATSFLYHDCDQPTIDWALTTRRLFLPVAAFNERISLNNEIPSTYIVATEDRTIRPDWQRRMARERLRSSRLRFQPAIARTFRSPTCWPSPSSPPPDPGDGTISQTVAVIIGVLHPGEMGAAVGAALRVAGQSVVWASTGRSAATAKRAEEAGLEDVGTLEELGRRSEVVVAVCPPHAAVEAARRFPRFAGIYVDANAVSPATAHTIAGLVDRCVDGGIVGPPPRRPGTTRLYLSGVDAPFVADLFAGTIVDARVVSENVGAASALKMAFAAWTKGTSALLLAVRAVARAEGVEATLLEEWQLSLPDLPKQSVAAARSALGKGWRWVGEMDEIAQTFTAAGLPDGFHRAAAEIYRRSPHGDDTGEDEALERVLASLARPASPQ
ncbi:MAG TPA: DUF1932 domain-containing protein [Gaiellaceae bacterium]|nr:DUF1932 domain-containing protein [Gaiellaceae bacterium]